MRRKFIAAVTSGVLALTVMAALPTHAEAVSIWLDLTPGTESVETVVLLSKGRSTRKRFGLSSLWKIWICPNFRMGQPIRRSRSMCWSIPGSNLYISQIKRKCGIGVGKNYNLPKSEDSRQPQCPPEKEKAIREAFKHFGMI